MRNYFLFLFFLLTLSTQAQKPISGFSNEQAKQQTDLETKFDAQLKAENLDVWLKRLAARPHHLGSPYGKQNAEFMRDMFKSWGYDANIETYKVLFPTPKTRLLELLGTTKFIAKLSETVLK